MSTYDYSIRPGESKTVSTHTGNVTNSWTGSAGKTHTLQARIVSGDKINMTSAGLIVNYTVQMKITNPWEYTIKAKNASFSVGGKSNSLSNDFQYDPDTGGWQDILSGYLIIMNATAASSYTYTATASVTYVRSSTNYTSTASYTIQYIPKMVDYLYTDEVGNFDIADANFLGTDYYGAATTSITLRSKPSISSPLTQQGYEPSRWYSDNASRYYNFSSTYSLSSNDTFIFVDWELAKYNLYLIDIINGGYAYNFEVTYNQSTNYNKYIGYSPSGYSFFGWYSGRDGSGDYLGYTNANGSDYWAGGKWAVKYGDIFYPYLISYVTYSTTQGVTPSRQQMMYSGSVSAASAPSNVDTNTYQFLGWSTTNDGSVTYNAGSIIKSSNSYKANLTLYAVWRRLKATITYNGNGHSISQTSQISYYSTTTTALEAKNVLGYDFKGWATSKTRADSGTIDYKTGDQIKAANVQPTDMTLYAVWEKIAFFSYGKQNNEWHRGIVYFKHNNQWKLSPTAYVKVNGAWRQIE